MADLHLRPTVLVVDDDPIILEVAREWLTQAGFVVSVREQALGTSRWVSTHQPDFILLDVLMPALGGSELATLLKQRAGTRNAGIVLYSSKPADQLERLASEVGALGYIEKSADAGSFIRRFRAIVSGSSGQSGEASPVNARRNEVPR